MKSVPCFLLALIFAAVWVISQAMEIAAVDLSTKLIWANIMYIPSTLTPVAYFFLAVQFVDLENLQKKRWLPVCLLLMPLAMNILLWTNDYHGLVRLNVFLDTSGPFSVVGKTYGPFFWIYTVYNYLLTIVTLLILIRGLCASKGRQRRAQILSLFLGLLLPACSVCVYISKIFPFKVDPTPIVIGLSGLIISWGIFRYRLFDIVKIAYSTVIREMCAGLIILDSEGIVLEINPAAASMLRLPSRPPKGISVTKLLEAYPQLISLFEAKINITEEIILSDDGGTNYYEVSLKRLEKSADAPLGWIMQIYNITKRKLEEEKIRHVASHDALTGLLNRAHFQLVFTEELAHAKMTASTFAVAYLDLDDFKLINDTYGHEAGDEYLKEVAGRLTGILRTSDIIARYGGDEYVILFPSVGENEKLEFISAKIFKSFEESFVLNGKALQLKASIGFSVYPRDGSSLDTLISKADKAMYAVKSTHKNSACIYCESFEPCL
ncbi:MAG: histidine kinase N-terminal 7TM domain-containing protein [Oscillospiraceae bacterium]